MTETQTIKCLVQNDLYESPHSEAVLETMEPGTIIEVEREEIEVSGVIMRVVRPRGAVQFDLEWFSILPDEEEPALPNNDLDDDFDTLVLDGVVQLAVSSKTCHVEGCAVSAPVEDSLTSDVSASRGSSVGVSAVVSGAHRLDAARKRVENCRVFLSAAQRQADDSMPAKKAAETSEKTRVLEKRQDELRRKTAYCDMGVTHEGGWCSRRESHRGTYSWASGLLAEQSALRQASSSEETLSEGKIRELLLKKVTDEIVANNVVVMHETFRQRVRDDDATCAEADDISKQLIQLKLELQVARDSMSRLVEPTTLLLHESLEALGSLEREAARCCHALSPELAMRVKRNREEAMLRRAEKRRLNDDLQRQAESDASAEPAISAGSVGA